MDNIEISIQPEDILRSPCWPEPLKVDLVKPFGGGYVHLVGVLSNSRTHIDQVLLLEEVLRLRLEGQFHSPPRQVF